MIYTKYTCYTAERVDKRTLGLLLLRGETVVSMQIEAPPPQKHHRGQAGLGGPGQARSAGRGMPVAPLSNAPQGIFLFYQFYILAPL